MHEKFFFRQMFSILICIKWKRAFCELYRETFEWGACEACLQVVHSRTFRTARARSQSKFRKVRSKELDSFESDSFSEIHQKPLKAIAEEVFLGRSRAVYAYELQTSVVYI